MSRIEDLLAPGEQLIWTGRPRQGLLLQWSDLAGVPLWLGMSALVVEIIRNGLETGRGSLDFLAVTGAMASACAFGLFGRFLLDGWLRARTAYGLTDQRLLILRGRRLTSIDRIRLRQVHLRGGRRGGRGTIYFGRPPGLFMGFERQVTHFVPSLYPTPHFLGVKRAAWIYDEIQASRVAPTS